MSLIKLTGIKDIKEPILAPVAAYPMVVLSQELIEKNDKTGIRLIFGILDQDPDGDEYQNIFDHMSLPGSGDDEDKIKFKMILIKRRLHWLDMDEAVEDEEFDPQDLVGCRSIIDLPISIIDPSEANKMREGRNIEWPPLPSEEEEE